MTLLVTNFVIKDMAWSNDMSSSWIISAHSKSRLFIGGYDKEKHVIHLGWQVTLEDGWKTYWRTPGDAGLPPRWTWKDNKNIRAISIFWPIPERMHIFDMETYVYKHEVILPIDVAVKESKTSVLVALDLDYMICEEICIPLEASYQLDISDVENIKISPFQKAQLDQYRALVPQRITDDTILVRIDPENSHRLQVTFPDNYDDVEDMIIEGPQGILFGQAKALSQNYFEVPYQGDEMQAGLDVTMTFLLKDGSGHEVTLRIKK
ncbi:MAG: hypothetical protein K9G26_11175 [Emcibacter sp.]|nr:hypothetical protein [Emcibacter sp.]